MWPYSPSWSGKWLQVTLSINQLLCCQFKLLQCSFALRLCSIGAHKADRGKVMKLYPISFAGILVLLRSAVVPIKHFWGEDSEHEQKSMRVLQPPAAQRISLLICTHSKVNLQTRTGISELNLCTNTHANTSWRAHTHMLTPRGDEGQTGLIVSSSRSREHIDFSHTPLSTHLPPTLSPLLSIFLSLPFFPVVPFFFQTYFSFSSLCLTKLLFLNLVSFYYLLAEPPNNNLTVMLTSENDLDIIK